jgi:hypothetical protein
VVQIWETKQTKEIVAIKIVRMKIKIAVAKTRNKADHKEPVIREPLRVTRAETREAKLEIRVAAREELGQARILVTVADKVASKVKKTRVHKVVNNEFYYLSLLKDLSCERSFSFLYLPMIAYLKV